METTFNRPLAQRLFTVIALSFFLLICTTGCSDDQTISEDIEQQLLETELYKLQHSSAHIKIPFPSTEEPGPPLYMRLATQLNQIYVVDGWVVIAFYREPDCINEDFNLLEQFDVPAAFSCNLLTSGFVIKERDAGPEVFPILVQSTGDAVPFWFINQTDFESIASDGMVTITELRNAEHLKGIATKFHETLKPNFDNHLVQIKAEGSLTDGRSFRYTLSHVGDETQNIRLRIR